MGYLGVCVLHVELLTLISNRFGINPCVWAGNTQDVLGDDAV